MNIINSTLKTEKISLQNYSIEGQFNVNPQYKKCISKVKENVYKAQLSVSITNTTENPFPIDLEIIFSGIFEFDQIENQKELDTFLNINAIQIIFPYIRSLVSTITGASLMQPLVLPIVDTRAFKDN